MSELPNTNKSLGQHWLTDEPTLEYICDAGDILPDDTVLEIGPGTGTLTNFLLDKAQRVIAVEFDTKLAESLKVKFKSQNLEVIAEDILKFDLTSLPTDYKVVANIPYYLTSNLIRVLSESPNRASRVVLLIQKEVAQRIAAKPGEMSILGVTSQYYWDVSLGEVVGAKMFTPPPKVDSQVIILNRKQAIQLNTDDTKLLFRLVKAGFASKRKTLLNSLSAGLRIDKIQAEELLSSSNISTTLRPQVLSIDNWIVLLEQAKKLELVF